MATDCLFCEEGVDEARPHHQTPYVNAERGVELRVAHHECALRQVLGSVAHLEKRCSCYVEGASEGDPEGMTRREAARAAVRLWQHPCRDCDLFPWEHPTPSCEAWR
jgi:hypothetical protein